MNQELQSKESIGRVTKALPWLKVFVRLAVGVGVTAILILRSDIEAVARALAAANPLGIAAATAMNVGLLIVSAFRWRVFLQGLGVSLPAPTILRLTFIGSFFNAFLPTGVGGDAYKAVRIHTPTTSLSTSFASVFLDRIAGIATLAAIALTVSGGALVFGTKTPLALTALALSVGILIVTTLVLLRGQRLIGRGQRRWFGIRPRLRRTLDRMVVAIRTPSTVGRSLTLGLAGQGLGIVAHASLASALDLGIGLDVITQAFLLTTVASAIPVTINGLGIREGVLVWSLALYGVAPAQALAYALLIFGVALATSAVGGVVYAVAGGEFGAPGAVLEPETDEGEP